MKIVFIGKKGKKNVFDAGFHYRGVLVKKLKVVRPYPHFRYHEEYLLEGICERLEGDTLFLRVSKSINLRQLELYPQS